MRYVMALLVAMISGVVFAQPLPDDLNEIKTLTAEQATMLAQRDGRLSLPGLTTLSDEAAEALSKHQGRLFLNGRTELSDKQADLLKSHLTIE